MREGEGTREGEGKGGEPTRREGEGKKREEKGKGR